MGCPDVTRRLLGGRPGSERGEVAAFAETWGLGMKRLASFALVVLILVAGVGTVGTPRRTTAQDDEAQATISALPTETARLQTRVVSTAEDRV